MFRFLRKTSLYLLAVPALLFGLGCLSNQVVLWANHDKFPVMWSSYKVAAYDLMLHEQLMSKSPEVVTQAELKIYALENEGFIDEVHVVMSPKTHLNALADIVDFGTTYSVGDGLLMLGEWLFGFAPFLFAFDAVRKLSTKD